MGLFDFLNSNKEKKKNPEDNFTITITNELVKVEHPKRGMEQKLEYINEGRGGYIVYKDKISEIKLFFEYGGGNCVAIIYVPTTSEWTNKTKLPITERNSILTFVAEQAIKDQAPKGYYELSDTYIEIFTKEPK